MIGEAGNRPALATGYYKNLGNDEYHGSAGLSSSNLKTLLQKTPAHLLHQRSEPNEPTPNMALGTAVHTMVLEPELAAAEIAVEPELNKRTKQGREDFLEFQAVNKNKTIITPEQAEAAEAMVASIRAHPIADILLTDIIAESSIYWRQKLYEEGGAYSEHLLKVRPDAVSKSHPVVIDLKTTIDASYTGFIKSVQNFHYHLSAAMYLDGVNQCFELLSETGHAQYERFVFVCVESKPPYCCSVYEMSADYIDIGHTLYKKALRTLVSAGELPVGYPQEIRVLEPPSWARRGFVV